MKYIAHVLAAALLSATAAFAQTPSSRASLNNGSPAASSLPVSLPEPSHAADSDGSQGRLVNAPVQGPIGSASGTLDESIDDAGDSSSQSVNGASKDPGNLHIFWVPAYIWFTGATGTAGAGGYTAPINANFRDVVSNLNIGYATTADIRYQRAGLLFDLYYAKLTGQEEPTPYGVLYGTVRVRAKALMVQPEVYGRLVDTRKFSIDATAGVRVWRLDSGLDFTAGRRPAFSVDTTEVWADPILGARFYANVMNGWFAELQGDGGIGENITWQTLAGGGKEFKQKYSVILLYRHLDVYNRNGGFLFDAVMNGAVLGFGIRFK